MKTLIQNATIIPQVPGADVEWFIGDVAIEDELIVAVGHAPDSFEPQEIIDATDHILMPGFVNCHAHSAMTLLRGFAEDLPLQTWLQDWIWPAEAKHTEKTLNIGNELAIAEMIKSGTTSFLDMYVRQDLLAESLLRTGMRGVLSRAVLTFEGDVEKHLQDNVNLKYRYQDENLVSVFVSAHAPYTCNDKDLLLVREAALEHDMGLHIHISETKKELDDYLGEFGKTPVSYLNDLNMFDAHTLGAHCVHITQEDMHIMSEKGVCVSHNPKSNLKLASGVAPLVDMLEHNITVGIGTDSVASNNSLSMIDEMKTASLLQKGILNDATVLPAKQILNLATREGAKALRLEDVGQIKVGYQADLILLDKSGVHMLPGFNPLTDVVHSATQQDVTHTMVAGKFLMRDRILVTIDEEKLRYDVSNLTGFFE
jgi:5-methylthioadenosine/S-adenosylhomocysteine deaminase